MVTMTSDTAATAQSGRRRVPPTSPSLLSRLVAWDVATSRRLHAAYTRRFPSILPLLILEYSGHGIPWLGLPAVAAAAALVAGTVDARVLLLPAGADGALPPAAAAATAAVVVYVGLLTDLAAVGAVKVTARRGRPAWNAAAERGTVAAVDRYAFPSGHTSRVVLLAVAAAAAPGVPPWVAAAVAVWAAAVAASRVALGRHHVLDIVAGAAVGVANYGVVTAVTPVAVAAVGGVLAGVGRGES